MVITLTEMHECHQILLDQKDDFDTEPKLAYWKELVARSKLLMAEIRGD